MTESGEGTVGAQDKPDHCGGDGGGGGGGGAGGSNYNMGTLPPILLFEG